MANVKIQFDEVGIGSPSNIKVDGMDLSGVVSDINMHLCPRRVGED